jgi:hypothetical protein
MARSEQIVFNPKPTPLCAGCDREPEAIDVYVMYANEEGITASEYVEREEGTYNPTNGHFLCDECYIRAGMPSSPTGWVCP